MEWPHEYLERTEVDGRTVLCVLTHDAKFDVPLLKLALRLPVAYVGAMGPRRTHLDRNERLRGRRHRAGAGPAALPDRPRPRRPDARGAAALSIAAEIVASRRGGSGASLTGAHIPIHHDPATRPTGRIGSVA